MEIGYRFGGGLGLAPVTIYCMEVTCTIAPPVKYRLMIECSDCVDLTSGGDAAFSEITLGSVNFAVSGVT